MDDEGCVMPVVLAHSVQLHLYHQREVVVRTRVEGLLHLPSLHEVVPREVLVVCLGRSPEGLSEDRLPLRVVVQQVEEPPTVELQHAVGAADVLGEI